MLVQRFGGRVEIQLDEASIGYIVRGKNGPNDAPGLFAQHADCVLSSGEPVGFFGLAGPGTASASWNSIAMNQRASALGYDHMLENRAAFVDVVASKNKRLYSTILIISEIDNLKCSLFNNYWWEKKEAEKGSFAPFHLLGRNCSSFAHLSFEELGLLTYSTRGLFLTPNKLFDHLISSSKINKYILTCYSGFIGFNPHEKIRRVRSRDKNAKYDIIIQDFREHIL